MTKIFVFDTNSLISANLLPNSVTRKAYDRARLIGVPVYSDATLIEFSQTFVRAKLINIYLLINESLQLWRLKE